MEKVRLHAVTRHGDKKIFIFRELESLPYVFLRHDAVGCPLQPQYDEPFRVIKRNEKNYTIKVNNCDITVSVDRFKPAFIVPDDLEEKTAETRNVLIPVERTNACDESATNINNQRTEENARDRYVTRFGQKVRFPDWYQTCFGCHTLKETICLVNKQTEHSECHIC
jgi:hypothetical protein